MTAEELKQLVEDADRIAAECLEQLNQEACPQLKDFFVVESAADRSQRRQFQRATFGKLLHSACNAKTSKDRKANNTISGIYVFGETTDDGVKPVYVGRSRDVRIRFRQHGYGGDHYQSSLAYLMARDAMSDEDHIALEESMRETNSRSKRASMPDDRLQAAMAEVREFRVYVFPEADDYRQYFCEVAVAGLLKSKWNKFRTH